MGSGPDLIPMRDTTRELSASDFGMRDTPRELKFGEKITLQAMYGQEFSMRDTSRELSSRSRELSSSDLVSRMGWGPDLELTQL